MAQTVAEKQTELDKLAEQVIEDAVCPELAEQATQLVFAEGPADAEVVFIGEAPGKQEDLKGKPFVGAAGKFLNEMLEENGLGRGSVYITNIVKYRPPNNRDPLPEEKQAFMPYLIRQLEIIRPKLIVFLGRHSLQAFFPSLAISKVHGRLLRKGEQMYLALYHPAAALYNGSMRDVLRHDFRTITRFLNKDMREEPTAKKEQNNIKQPTLFDKE